MTWNELTGRYGKPLFEADLIRYTEDERLIWDIPDKVAVFATPSLPSHIIVYGRVTEDKWIPNYGQRQLIRELLKKCEVI